MTTKRQQQQIQQGLQDATKGVITPHGHTTQDVHGTPIDSGANLSKVTVEEYLASHPGNPNERDVTTGYRGFKGGKPLSPAQQLALRKAVQARAQQQLAQPNQTQPTPPTQTTQVKKVKKK